MSKYILVHMWPKDNAVEHKFDTLISPNGSIAALTQILHQQWVNHKDIIAIDQWINSNINTQDIINSTIDQYNQNSEKVLIWYSCLLYNAETTKQSIALLKEKYWDEIIIVLWWQHPTQMYKLLNNNVQPFLSRGADKILLWDWEALLPSLVQDINENKQNLDIQYNRIETDTQQNGKFNISYGKFATMDYSCFYNFRELLQQQRKEVWFTQICRQGDGWPGCSRAANNKDWACGHCALDNITIMNNLWTQDDMRLQFETIRKIKENTQETVDRIFRVDNQFLPYPIQWNNKKNLDYLDLMIEHKKKYEKEYGFSFDYYIYLTELSLENEEIIDRLAQLWVIETYVWFDHFHPSWLKEQNKWSKNKSQRSVDHRCEKQTVEERYPWLKNTLDLLKKYNIKGSWVL